MNDGILTQISRWASILRQTAMHWTLTHPSGRWVVLGASVGFLCGIASAIFEISTDAIAQVLLGHIAGLPQLIVANQAIASGPQGAMSPIALIIVLGGGGLVAGLIIFSWSDAARGGGTGKAVHAFHHERGMIPFSTSLAKMAASTISLGSGGSGGREGPISLIGAGLGSWFACKMRLTVRDRRILLAAGIAGGIAAVFRAPLAAAIFAAEVLYRGPELEADVLIPGFISAAVGYLVGSMALDILGPMVGHHASTGSTLFQPPSVAFHAADWMQLTGYTLVAIGVVFVARWFIALQKYTVRRFDQLPLPFWLKPALGGMAAGIIALGLYAIARVILRSQTEASIVLGTIGSGYGVLHHLFAGGCAAMHPLVLAALLLAIALGKCVTTALTTGSGGSAGLFGPSIVIGGCVGGTIGFALSGLPISPPPAACILIGMAGMLAATHRTPIAALLMVSEIAGTWLLLLPAMWVCGIAFLLTGRRSLISGQVDGIQDSPAHRSHLFADVLAHASVGELLAAQAPGQVVPGSMPIEELRHLIQGMNQDHYPVINKEGMLTGMISRGDIAAIAPDSLPVGLVLADDLADGASAALSPTQSLATALRLLHQQQVEELPVVDANRRYLGMITSGGLMHFYRVSVDRSNAERAIEGFSRSTSSIHDGSAP